MRLLAGLLGASLCEASPSLFLSSARKVSRRRSLLLFIEQGNRQVAGARVASLRLQLSNGRCDVLPRSAALPQEKKFLNALEARVWSLAAKMFSPTTFPAVLPPPSAESLHPDTVPAAMSGISVSALESAAEREGPGMASIIDDGGFSSYRRGRNDGGAKEPNSLEKLLQTELLWVYWKERNCFDSVLKPFGCDQLAYSEKDVSDEDLLPFIVQTAVSTADRRFTRKDTEGTECAVVASGSVLSSGTGQSAASGCSVASGESVQKEAQSGRQKSQEPVDEKKSGHVAGNKESEKSAAPASSAVLAGKLPCTPVHSESGEKTQGAREKVLEEARRLAQQAEASKGSCWYEDSPATKLTRGT